MRLATHRRRHAVVCAAMLWGHASLVHAQQRPLLTEDPEVIGAGRMLIEAGAEFGRDIFLPASGLRGDVWTTPSIGVSIGLGSIVEFQVDGSLRHHLKIFSQRFGPLQDVLDVTGNSTASIGDLVLGTKIRLVAELEGRPAFGVRVATKLPSASKSSGLGLGTVDFHTSLLVGKTVRSVRVVGNVGLGVLSDPVEAAQHDNVVTFGGSFARALTDAFEVVGEITARIEASNGSPTPALENRGQMRVGARFTRGTLRLDAAFLGGMTTADPSWGATLGATYVFDAFSVP